MEVWEGTSEGSAQTGPPKQNPVEAEQSQHQLGTRPRSKAQQSRAAGVCPKPPHQGWPRPSESKGPKAKWEDWEEATDISLEGQGRKEAVWSAPQGSGVTVNLAWLEDTPESLPKFGSLGACHFTAGEAGQLEKDLSPTRGTVTGFSSPVLQ